MEGGGRFTQLTELSGDVYSFLETGPSWSSSWSSLSCFPLQPSAGGGVSSVLLMSPRSDPEGALRKLGDLLVWRVEDCELVDGLLRHFGETTKVAQRSTSV